MTADGLGIDAGDLFPAGSLAPQLCSFPAPAFSTWPTGAACPVTVRLPPADGLCSVVPHASSAVHLTPSAWVSHWPAYASGLQWPASLDTPPIDDHTCGISAHPGQPYTPDGAYSQAAGLLCGFPSGVTCALAGYTISSSTRPPLSCHQGLDAILATELPLDDPLAIAPVYWQQFVLHRSTATSIADLYTETRTMLRAGLEQAVVAHSAISRAWTLEI